MTYWTYVGITAALLGGVCGFVALVALMVEHLPAWLTLTILFLVILFLFPLLMMQGR